MRQFLIIAIKLQKISFGYKTHQFDDCNTSDNYDFIPYLNHRGNFAIQLECNES